ncbi:MAG: penicillin acylase family protein [Sandaracinaceae bacterium]
MGKNALASARSLAAPAVALFVGACSCDGATTADAGSLEDGGPIDAGPLDVGPVDAGDPCEAEITPPSCRPRFEGLSAPVEVIRDTDGIPHIFAETDADAYFASGYMQATDRPLQMELARRRALGRRAEVLGEGQVEDDTLMRIVGIGRWGAVNASLVARERPSEYVLLEAWVAGVNRRLEEIRSGAVPRPAGLGADGLDFVPEPWTADEALAVGKLVLFGNANQIEYDILASLLARYFPDVWAAVPLYQPVRDAHTVPPDERPPAALSHREASDGLVPLTPERTQERPPLPPDAAERMRRFFARFEDQPGLSAFGGASNNWAVDGRHTVDGTPFIAGDPHQGFSSPNIFWLHHLHSTQPDGGLDVIGWSFLGSPAIQLGHNRHLVWTATTTYPDVMDLWSVRGDAESVMIGTTRVPIERRTETIRVRDAEPIELVIETVPGYGVILPRDLPPLPITGVGERLLFRWIGFAPTREAEGFQSYDVARTLEDFERAADLMEIGAFNFVAATADGIAYRSSPHVPVRRAPVGGTRTPWTILDGDDEGTFWTDDILGPTQLPRSRGGARGWIATANNEPFGFNDDGDWANGPFYFGVYFDPGTRAYRIEQELTRLTARGSVTFEEMQALQLDTHSELADDVLPGLFEVWDARATDPALAPFRDRADLDALVTTLRGWDRRMDRTSPEALVFNTYLYVLTRRLLADEFSVVFDPVLEAEPMYLLKLTSFCVRGTIANAADFFDDGRSATIVAALADVADWLTTRFGGVEPSRYTWADVHGAVFRSIYGSVFSTDWVATDGGDGTVDVAKARALDGERIRDRIDVGSGAVYRMTARFREDGTPEAWFQMPRGVSGDPASPHYDDLHEDWVEGRYRRLRFERDEIEAAASESFVIAP